MEEALRRRNSQSTIMKPASRKTSSENSAIFQRTIERNFKFLYFKNRRIKIFAFCKLVWNSIQQSTTVKKNFVGTHPTNVMIFADDRARRERLTPLDHNRVLVVMNSAGCDASRGEFPLLALFRNKHAFGVRFLVLRLPRFLVQLFVFLLQMENRI